MTIEEKKILHDKIMIANVIVSYLSDEALLSLIKFEVAAGRIYFFGYRPVKEYHPDFEVYRLCDNEIANRRNKRIKEKSNE